MMVRGVVGANFPEGLPVVGGVANGDLLEKGDVPDKDRTLKARISQDHEIQSHTVCLTGVEDAFHGPKLLNSRVCEVSWLWGIWQVPGAT
jgi:hypothetical protein